MERDEAKSEFRNELETLITLSIEAMDDADCCRLTDLEFLEWANLLYGFNISLAHLKMNMQTHHRTEEFH